MMLDSYVSEILLLFFILMTINFSLTKQILCIFLKEMDANVCRKKHISDCKLILWSYINVVTFLLPAFLYNFFLTILQLAGSKLVQP